MAFVSDTYYVGFFADDYNTLVTAAANYPEILAALATGENGWFAEAADGDFYVLKDGYSDQDFLNLLVQNGLDTTVDFQMFHYLNSTWNVGGFG